MKKLLLLILLLVVPVYATTFQRGDFVNGDVSSDDFSLVMCEREKRSNSVRVYSDPICCLNLNGNGWCENDEPVLGSCYDNLCLWATPSYTPWYSMRYRSSPCESGLSVLTGREYSQLLLSSGCKPKDTYWCCGDAFPQVHNVIVQSKPVEEPKTSPTGALLILTETKWKALQMGYYRNQGFEQLALKSERARCASGGGSIRIIDPKYGSYFADTRNFQPGARAFYLSDGAVTPLVTWC